MATWPANLPAPLVEGHALEPVDPVVRTDMEVGAPRARRRTSARNDRYPVSWLFTDSEMASFRSWYDDDTTGIAGGSAWFNVSLYDGHGAQNNVEARFAGIYKAQVVAGRNWRVTAVLEVR